MEVLGRKEGIATNLPCAFGPFRFGRRRADFRFAYSFKPIEGI